MSNQRDWSFLLEIPMSREVGRSNGTMGPRTLRGDNLQSGPARRWGLMLIVDGDRARRSRPEPADPSVIIQTKVTIDQKSQMLTEGEKPKSSTVSAHLHDIMHSTFSKRFSVVTISAHFHWNLGHRFCLLEEILHRRGSAQNVCCVHPPVFAVFFFFNGQHNPSCAIRYSASRCNLPERIRKSICLVLPW